MDLIKGTDRNIATSTHFSAACTCNFYFQVTTSGHFRILIKLTQVRPRGRVRNTNSLYTGGKLTIACNHSHLRYNNNNKNADKEKQ